MTRKRALLAEIGEEFNPLKYLLTARRMTVQELAQKAGLTKGTIYGWLKPCGMNKATVKSLRKVADVLGVNPTFFLDFDFKPQPFIFIRSSEITNEFRTPVIGHTKGNMSVSRHNLTVTTKAEDTEFWRRDGEAALYVAKGKLAFLYEHGRGSLKITKGEATIRCKVEILSEGDIAYIDSQHFHGIYLPSTSDPHRPRFWTEDNTPKTAVAILFQHHE